MQILEELEQEIMTYIGIIHRENFSKKYDGLVDILLSFRHRGVKKEEVESVLTAICDKDGLDEYQEEVIIEVANRLIGYCRPSARIDW